jgi:hypothetical protein
MLLAQVGASVQCIIIQELVIRKVGSSTGVLEFENAHDSSLVLTISNRVQQGDGERAIWAKRRGSSNQRFTVCCCLIVNTIR